MKEEGCIVVAGFGSSGSGAVVDFLSEFRGNVRASNTEFRLIKDYGGIQDLAAYWEGRSLQNSQPTLDAFVHLFNQEYRKGRLHILGPARRVGLGDGSIPQKELDEFLDKILLLTFPGIWIVDADDRMINSVRKAVKVWTGTARSSLLDPEADFDTAVGGLLRALRLRYIKDSNYRFAIYDQGLDPSNMSVPEPWLTNMRGIVVTRDPRDQFISWCTTLKHLYPTDVNSFCLAYEKNMGVVRALPTSVLHVEFEAFILKHDNEKHRIMEYLNLAVEDHLRPRHYFDPEISSRRIGKSRADISPEIKTIEDRLAEYLRY